MTFFYGSVVIELRHTVQNAGIVVAVTERAAPNKIGIEIRIK